MKTLIKSLALALSLAVITSAATFAQSNPASNANYAASYKTGIYTSKSGNLHIALDKNTGSTVDIRLANAEGRVLFSQHLGKNDQVYRTRLNLNELEDGIYELEITDGTDVTAQTVTIVTKFPVSPQRLILTEAVASRN